MPKYEFFCETCNLSMDRYTSKQIKSIICDKCNGEMSRCLPNTESRTQVKEVIDSYMNVKHNDDQKSDLKERKAKYYKEVEIPRLIQKYGEQTAFEEGWLVVNDKGEIEINRDFKMKV